MARDPKHDILFQPIKIGPKDAAQSVLPGTALHRRGFPNKPGFPGGRIRSLKAGGRLGGNQYRVLFDSSRIGRHPSACRRAIWDAGDVRNLRAMEPITSITNGFPWPGSSSGYGASHGALHGIARDTAGPESIRLGIRNAHLLQGNGLGRYRHGPSNTMWDARTCALATAGFRHRLCLRPRTSLPCRCSFLSP